MKDLESRIVKIEERNKKVEVDKAWENSYSRKILVAVFTYIVIAIYFKYVLRIDPWVNAIVPTLGFLLSTLAFPYFKGIWSKYFYKTR